MKAEFLSCGEKERGPVLFEVIAQQHPPSLFHTEFCGKLTVKFTLDKFTPC